jgi:hypothetical protein
MGVDTYLYLEEKMNDDSWILRSKSFISKNTTSKMIFQKLVSKLSFVEFTELNPTESVYHAGNLSYGDLYVYNISTYVRIFMIEAY